MINSVVVLQLLILGKMAALSHIKNRKEAKARENIEQIIQKCANPSGDVCKNTFIGLLRLEVNNEREFRNYVLANPMFN